MASQARRLKRSKQVIEIPRFYEAPIPENMQTPLLISTNRFKKTPVILIEHKSSVDPIGIASVAEIKNRSVIFTPTFHKLSTESRVCNDILISEQAIINFECGGFIEHGQFILIEISVLLPIYSKGDLVLIRKPVKPYVADI